MWGETSVEWGCFPQMPSGHLKILSEDLEDLMKISDLDVDAMCQNSINVQ